MHLETLEIVNFRGIGRLKLRLEEDTTVLFGENAWGKTSLVEALATVLGRRPLEEGDFHRITLGKSPIARRLVIALGFAGEPDAALEPAGWRDEAGVFHVELAWIATRRVRGRVSLARRFRGPEGRDLNLPGVDAALLADRLVQAHPLFLFRELRLADWMLTPVMGQGPVVREDPGTAVARIFERLLTQPHQVHPEELARGLGALQRLAEQRPQLFAGLPMSGRRRRVEDMADAPVSLQDNLSLSDLARRAGAGTRQVALLVLMGAMLRAEAESAQVPGAQPLLLLEDPETHLHPIQLATAWNLVSQLPVQKLVTTARGELLAGQPTRALRRLVRHPDHVEVFPTVPRPLSTQQARRVAFHVRTHRAEALFARVWLLVEGETEAWLLPELARTWGLNFALEGVACVEFAQAGLSPLVAFADRFGIPWHVLADGDMAGQTYAAKTRHMLRGRKEVQHLTLLPTPDIEHLLFQCGYASIFRRQAGAGPQDPESLIHRALRRTSKPGMALELAEAADTRGPAGIPTPIKRMLATLRRLAAKG